MRHDPTVRDAVLVAATVATAYAAIRGQISAVNLGAAVPVLVAISVSLERLSRGQRARCVRRSGK